MIRNMTPSERTAYDQGIQSVIDAARITAITVECADDANTFRKRVTAEALAAFAEAAEGLKLAAPAESPACAIMGAIADDPATWGTLPCPTCAGRVQWGKDSSNGHIHAQCETPGCWRIVQ